MAKGVADQTAGMSSDEADYFYLLLDMRRSGPKARQAFADAYAADLKFRWKIQGIPPEEIKERIENIRLKLLKELVK